MDIFDQYLYDELIELYEKSDLTVDDYKELYHRFCNLDYLEETKPYIFTMRYLGLGTSKESEMVLKELESSISEANYELKGLYYDFL